jgi:hypothetical protein
MLDAVAAVVQTEVMKQVSFGVVIVACVFTAGAAAPAARSGDPPTVAGSSLEAFERALDSHDSATEVLRAWCGDHRMADPPVIRAVRDRKVDKPAGAEVRRLLRATPGEPIRYRRVVLMCGVHALSEADNWYRPRQLTGAMNVSLDTTDTPFGVVVRPLGFHRVRLAPGPVPDRLGPGAGARSVVLRRALLVTPGGSPFSLVAETYSSEIFAFGKPSAAPLP